MTATTHPTRALALLTATAFCIPLAAQTTGRTMSLVAPPVVGQVASFSMTYPVAAAGNPYAFLWCTPQYPGTTTIAVPGVVVLGLVRVDPLTSSTPYSGLLGASGTVTHSVPIPNNPAWIGYAWDLQSFDLQMNTLTLRFSDNDLGLAVGGGAPTGGNMIPIAPGTFQMGSNATTASPYYSQANERPVHQVTISHAFWIGQYEVTQAEYLGVMGTNPSQFQGATRPVEMVTWNNAMAFCATLTARERAAGRVPAGYQYRLPTEAEWEYCCRAGTTTEFNIGASLSCGQANFSISYHSGAYCSGTGNCPGPIVCNNSTVVVGGYAPNPSGLYDMHGNVREWCLDGWNATANYPSGAVTDPYVTSGFNRIHRGGGWSNGSGYVRSAVRSGSAPTTANNGVGFRVVLAPSLVP